MSGTLGLILQGIGQSVANEAKHALADEAKRNGEKTLLAVLIGWMALLFFVVCVVTLAVAAYLFLALTHPAHEAMGMVSLGAICLSGICALTVRSMLKADPKPAPTPVEAEADLAALLSELESETKDTVKRNATNATLISLVAGIAMGMNPNLRKSIFSNFTS